MNTITIYKDLQAGCYMAKYSNPEIAELFGTSLLPTAYTLSASAEHVVAEIAKLNPYETVVLGA